MTAIPNHIRTQLHERALNCCEICGSPEAYDAHHRLRRSQRGKDTLSNLLLLCRRHHDSTHHYPAQARRRGHLLKWGQRPTEVPVWRFDRTRGMTWLVLLRDDGTIDEEVPAWANAILLGAE